VSYHASVREVVAIALGAWKPPPKLTLSEWADEHFYLSPGMAAEHGRWHTLPYQRGIMDAITDPTVERVSLMKSARVGGTLMANAAIGYYIHQDPAPILYVLPTVENAEGHSKDTIAPMLRDVPVLAAMTFQERDDTGPRGSGNKILHKVFPGGALMLVGANSGAGLRRVGARVLVLDEADAYPPSAGADGDPIELATMRTQAYWNRKIIAISTPLVEGASQIERLFNEGDCRRYFVPCPSCGHLAPLVFNGENGHRMQWPEGEPAGAFFTCQLNGCVIEHHQKRDMIARGVWRSAVWNETEKTWAAKEFKGHASFHIWAAYSFSPNATWKDIAEAFLKAKDNPQKLKTFVNTWLGEVWKERGEAPDYQLLYQRREAYAPGTVPAGSLLLTCGVDVQKDRFVYEVVSWGAGKRSWSVDIGVIPADTANEAEWAKLNELLARTYPGPDGVLVVIGCLAVDSGYNTNVAYAWARTHSMDRVIAVKGAAGARSLIGAPSKVDVTIRGKRVGYKVWPLGVDIAKSELYGWLHLKAPKDGDPYPPGFCHFPEYDEEYFKQITAEHLVSRKDGRGFVHYEWQLIQGRENHWLDCRVYARAAASLKGLDRMRAPVAAERLPLPAPAPTDPRLKYDGRVGPAPRSDASKFLGGRARGKSWLGR
jgi:phage terminase large subunit GpA-like protein